MSPPRHRSLIASYDWSPLEGEPGVSVCVVHGVVVRRDSRDPARVFYELPDGRRVRLLIDVLRIARRWK